jgi:hypothetical protein
MTSSNQLEACAGCGRDTHTGTRLFSDRRTTRAEDGSAIYLSAIWPRSRPGPRDSVSAAVAGSGLGPAAGRADTYVT